MRTSRREIIGAVAGFGAVCSVLGAGVQAKYRDFESSSGTLKADQWVEPIVYATGSGNIVTAWHDTDITTHEVGNAALIGHRQEVFNGQYAIPYVTTGGELRYLDSEGSHPVSTGNTTPPTSQSLLTTGTWNGSPESIFYTEDPIIYRIHPDEQGPTEVADLSNNAKAVVGIDDVDSDGTDELLFVDGSAEIRYLKPGDLQDEGQEIGTKVENGMGSNNQYGVGAPIQTANGPRIPVVGGSNNIQLRNVDETDTTLTQNGPAKKSAVAGRDIDGDGTSEIIFINNSNSELRYADDLSSISDSKVFYDGNGEEVTNADPAVGIL